MDTVKSFHVHVWEHRGGLEAELQWFGSSGRFIRADRYEGLNVAELLCVVEAALETARPGDGFEGGAWQPRLF